MNAREQVAYDFILAKYPEVRVYNSGWPDFMVVHEDGEVHGVEVKSITDPLADHQAEVHFHLNDAGIPTGVMTVECGQVAGFNPYAYIEKLYGPQSQSQGRSQ